MYNRFDMRSVFAIFLIIMLIRGFFSFSETELLNTLLILPGLILSLTIHEFAHAKVSDRLRRPNARKRRKTYIKSS